MRPPPHHFSESQVPLLLGAANAFWRTVVYLGTYSGLRRDEMLRLYWTDIDFDRNLIKVTEKEATATKPAWQPKTYERRDIPMLPELAQHLRRWKELNQGHREVLPWVRQNTKFSEDFTELRKRAGLEQGSLHSLRHTFGSWLAAADVNLFKIQKLMGHRRVASTQIYIHFQPSNLDKSVQKLPWISPPDTKPA